MKKITVIIIFALMSVAGFAQTNDTSATGLLHQYIDRPEKLSSKQAFDLIAHPGKVQTVFLDTVMVASYPALLPFLNSWYRESRVQSIYFRDMQWHTEEKSPVYFSALLVNILGSSLICLSLVYLILIPVKRARDLKLCLAQGWMKSHERVEVFAEYQKKKLSKTFPTFDETIYCAFSLGITGMVVGLHGYNIWVFLSFLWWSSLVLLTSRFFRNLFVSRVITHIKDAHIELNNPQIAVV